jgi:pyridoxine 5-phosphate synthase
MSASSRHPAPPIRLGINIDHVATLRNARGGDHPDPLRAANLAIEAGADNITAHLREDRRHITDADVARLIAELRCPLNLEMAATPEMLAIALKTQPHAACLVPEKRTERTTEGGLDAVGQHNLLAPVVSALADAGIQVSLFIAPELRQIEAAARLRAPAIEIHVGAWCDALGEGRMQDAEAEWRRIREGALAAHDLGLEVHAGHGLNYATAETIAGLPEVVELNIGHFLVGEAIFVGLGDSVRRMRAAMNKGRQALRHSDAEQALDGTR